MVILGNFTDKVTFELKYEGKGGEVVEFWVFFFFFFDCLAIRFVDGLNAGHERKGIKGDFLVWGLSSKQD